MHKLTEFRIQTSLRGIRSRDRNRRENNVKEPEITYYSGNDDNDTDADTDDKLDK